MTTPTIKPFKVELFAYILATMGVFWGLWTAAKAWNFNEFGQLAFFFFLAFIWYCTCMVCLMLASNRRRYLRGKAVKEQNSDGQTVLQKSDIGISG
jgi:hypothetical protein